MKTRRGKTKHPDERKRKSTMLLKVADFARKNGTAFPTADRVYAAIAEGVLPPGVVVRLGRKILINEDRYQEWVASGGAALPGGWKREAA